MALRRLKSRFRKVKKILFKYWLYLYNFYGLQVLHYASTKEPVATPCKPSPSTSVTDS